MATSEVDICNTALIALSANTIMALDDGSNEALLCNQYYPHARDATLQAHPWNPAIRRAVLAREATTPAFGYNFAFSLPTDPYCLRVLEVDPDETPYVIEGRLLLSDEEVVKIRYVSRLTDVQQYSPLLADTIAARLSWHLAYPLTEHPTIQASMLKMWGAKLAEARSIDSQEGSPQDIGIGVLVDVRDRGRFVDPWRRNSNSV